MLFNLWDSENEYHPFPNDDRFLIMKQNRNKTWILHLKDPNEEYPVQIGEICLGLKGTLENATNLGWYISTRFQNQGIMSKFLALYLSETTPNENGFAVQIAKANTPSLKLATKNGFVAYGESDRFIYLKR